MAGEGGSPSISIDGRATECGEIFPGAIPARGEARCYRRTGEIVVSNQGGLAAGTRVRTAASKRVKVRRSSWDVHLLTGGREKTVVLSRERFAADKRASSPQNPSTTWCSRCFQATVFPCRPRTRSPTYTSLVHPEKRVHADVERVLIFCMFSRAFPYFFDDNSSFL